MSSAVSDASGAVGLKGPIFAGIHNLQLIAGAILAIFVLRLIVFRFTSPLAKLPGPEISKWTRLVFLYHYFAGDGTRYVHSLHEEYGPIVRVGPERVDICDAYAVKDIHNIHSTFRKSKYYSYLVGGRVETMFSTSDPKFHGQRRRLLGSALSDSALVKLETQITSRVSLAIRRIAEEMQARKTADILKWWLFMATDIIGELSFGESFQMLETGEVRSTTSASWKSGAELTCHRQKNDYIAALESIASSEPFRTNFPHALPWIARLFPLPKFKRALKLVQSLILYSTQSLRRYTKMLEDSPNPKQTLFTKIFEKGDLSFEEIRQEAQAYIVAGSDTTSNTLTYLVYTVSRHPEIQARLVAEVAALPEGYSDNDLRELPYLNHVILETLRLHTAVPGGLPRDVPPGGYNFNGFFIPPAMMVTTQAYSLHRDPAAFPDPESFRPERWEDPTQAMKDMSFPFGGGSRICIGIHLAKMELRLATAMFFRRFPHAHMSSREGMTTDDMEMKAWFLMTPKGGRCLMEA
ncbi:hypothetical protein N7468_008923 [Penicillium chermesinum]|uniref:Cytochrome P450 n=1 Tax=Penicillium chermesinum TaxID=63820 RepID=A0A9W9NGU5_9EURO|nr:uncharacterized protein N7468_008923 [Penicillium chermesinum]KAJ5219719.1 hypothetical protein N7468_008923 [Penicillium chermesinum]KAJ6153718.1 hypothetical protein N7470_006677 [Penicillium chermesinum]